MRVISLLSLEEEEETTRSSSPSYSRLRGSRSSLLSHDVGRGSLLLWDAAVEDLPGNHPRNPLGKRSSCLADDDAEDLSSLCFVVLRLDELY